MHDLGEVDHAFRHHYGRLVAQLTRVFGPGRIDLVEDVVQDAMLKATRSWPFTGVPDQPEAWLSRVARNLALDVIRHDRMRAEHTESVAQALQPEHADRTPEDVADDSLRMIFTCCHPALHADSRVALTLKTLCGFGSREIASALLTKESTIAQRLTRAKAKLQRENVAFEVPAPRELGPRLDSVLEVIYLVFNEGYRAHRGADLVRLDLLHEAIRLANLLTELPQTDEPRVHALLALMLFLGARVPARVDDSGDILTLAEQDRSKWDRNWIGAALHEFERAAKGKTLSSYHVEASIASLHAMAADYEDTDWTRILDRYDDLVALTGSPVARLNRCVAVATARDVRLALDELERLAATHEFEDYLLLPVTRAHLLWHLDARDAAVAQYRAALELPATEPERALLLRRLAACERGDAAPRF